jgi:cation-transporting ATPase 13A1
MLQRDKSKKKQVVPCDLLMLSGSVVVNEAILTGESQPLVKEGIATLDETEIPLDMNGTHKMHLLHSGTDILQFTPADDMMEELP